MNEYITILIREKEYCAWLSKANSPMENPNSNHENAENGNKTSKPLVTAEPLWTVEEVASYMRLRPETIRAKARRGELPGVKVGRVWRFRSELLIRKFVLEND
jgi:excisionase family DNA binding protein